MGNDGISILICCYNSKATIVEALAKIQNQEVDHAIKWEVILVDNGSKDNTREIARKSWNNESCTASFKILEEPLPGKSNALKRGINSAIYEFVLICDDDNLLEKDYLQTAYDIMINNPQIGFLGGCGYPKTNDGILPGWFGEYKNLYACGEQGRNNDITFVKNYVYGAGAVFRRSIFKDLNADNYLRVFPGRKKGNLVGGEDNLMGHIAVIAGYKIWYSDQLKFVHLIKKDRLKWNYVTNIKYSNGRAQIYLDPFTDYITDNIDPDGFVKQIITNTKHILSLVKKERLGLFKKKEGNRRNLILYYYLGKIKELLRLNFSYSKEYQKSIRYCQYIQNKKRGSMLRKENNNSK